MRRFAILLSSVALAACTSTGPSDPAPGVPDAGAGDTAADASPTLAIPFAVDDWYAATGHMGDGEQPGAIAEEETCAARGGDARGLCHRFTWEPGSAGWAGVYWQHPPDNWGELPGLRVPAGATGVSFYAWGAAGGEAVGFMVGMAQVDGFEVKREDIVLTTEPVKHTLALSDTGYTDVVGGFGWVAAESADTVVFHVDDIVWE